MSAMHAMALPERDPDRRSAAICRFHGRTVRSRVTRAQASAGDTVRARAAADRPARGKAPASQGPSSQAPADQTVRSPAAATGSARTPPASSGPGRALAASTGPVRPPGSSSRMAGAQAVRAQAVRAQAVRAQAVRAQAVRAQAATVPLRLTRRGRAVIAVAVAILVTAVSLIASGVAQATSHSVPPRAAGQHLTRVVVRPGQSLWSVAASADPGADTRLVVRQIVELNGLAGDVVLAGQQLWVPRG
jgi:LysM domain